MTQSVALIEVTVTHGQLCVFDHAMRFPFNEWRTEDTAQGFAWRAGSVSFRTILDGGPTEVDVKVVTEPAIQGNAARAILVPFSVPASGEVEVGTVSGDSSVFRVEPGEGGLLYEHGTLGDEKMWCRLTFIPGLLTEPKLLRADERLHPRFPLRMDAKAAV